MTGKCKSCWVCCKLFLINLNEKEYKSGKYRTIFQGYGEVKSFSEARKNGANFLGQNKDGSCVYLDGDLCGIHSDRPAVCRNFFCDSKSKKFERMKKIINENRD